MLVCKLFFYSLILFSCSRGSKYVTLRPLDCHKTLNSQDQNSYGIADEIGDDIGECDFYLCMKVVTSGRFAWFSESILSPKWPAHAVTKAWIGKKSVHISLNKKKNWDSACSVSSVDEDMRITVKINAFFLFAKAPLSCPVIFEHSCTIQNAIQRHETKK